MTLHLIVLGLPVKIHDVVKCETEGTKLRYWYRREGVHLREAEPMLGVTKMKVTS